MLATNKYPVNASVSNAARFADWIKNRGGVAVWESLDLGDPDWSVFTPALTEDCRQYPAPSWKASPHPLLVTDPKDILLYEKKEIKRIRIGLQRGSGFSITLTAASSQKVRATLAKLSQPSELNPYAKLAWYEFEDREAVFYIADEEITLDEWLKKQDGNAAQV